MHIHIICDGIEKNDTNREINDGNLPKQKYKYLHFKERIKLFTQPIWKIHKPYSKSKRFFGHIKSFH